MKKNSKEALLPLWEREGSRCIVKRGSVELCELALIATTLVPAVMSQAQCVTAKVPSGQQPSTLQAGARAVFVDVVVNDKGNRTRIDLQQDNFHITEDGSPQITRSFTFHSAGSPAAPELVAAMQTPFLDKVSNYHPSRVGQTINILLLDTLNTALADQQRTRQQVAAVLASLPPGEPIALFTLGTRLKMIQDFTQKPDTLIAAASQIKSHASPLYIEHGPDQIREDDSVSGADVMKQHARSRLTFEVSSIRPDRSEGRPVSDFPIGPGRVYVPRGGVFRARHILPIQYIGFAYNLTESQMAYLAAHVPDWVTTERFAITASVEGRPGEDQLRSMMQSLLEDRFKLEIHKQDREVSVLALVLAKPGLTGPRLTPHSLYPPCPETAPPAEAQESLPAGFPVACHGIVILPPSTPGRVRLGARDVTLSLITDALSGSAIANFDRPLIDRTGLTGRYDFALECTHPNSTALRLLMKHLHRIHQN